jgi:hypothetical protein
MNFENTNDTNNIQKRKYVKKIILTEDEKKEKVKESRRKAAKKFYLNHNEICKERIFKSILKKSNDIALI